MQRQFVLCLLNQSSFSKHLTAVRETNTLLKRAVDIRDADEGRSMKVCTCCCLAAIPDCRLQSSNGGEGEEGLQVDHFADEVCPDQSSVDRLAWYQPFWEI